MSFFGKNVLIIGGGASIAEEVIDSFLAKGANLMVTINERNPSYLVRNKIKITQLDLTSSMSLDKFCKESLAAFGNIDILIFLTGLLPGKSLAEYDDELIEKVMKVNFTGQALFLRRVLANINQGSAIVILSSISGERGSFDPIYAAAKAAQIGFVKSLATWLAPKVRVNAIAPSLIESSSMFYQMSADRREFHREQSPTGKLISKSELAGIIINLCEPSWSNVNGQVISVNGGMYV
jgi:3-oxoacyl-[acyl-carrier protein] reductase